MKDTNYITFTGVGLGLLLLISIFSFWSGDKYLKSRQWRDHSADVLAKINDLQIAVERAELAQRSYIITDRPEFVKVYAREKKIAETAHEVFAELIDHHPQLTEMTVKLEALIASRLDSLNSNLGLALERRTPDAINKIRQGNGLQLMTEVLAAFEQIKRSETETLSARANDAEQAFLIARYLVAFGLVLSFAFLLSAMLFLRNEMRRRAQVEKSLIQAEAKAHEASALKSQFLANMSHEIRTPLNGIIGMGRILCESDMTSDQRGHLDVILDSSNSLLTLINGILDLSKIESGKMQLEEIHFELRSLIQSSRSILDCPAGEKSLKIEVAIADNVPDHFIGDPLRIRQILINLVNNAIKFSAHGKITVKVSLLEEANSLTQLYFEVIDQGIGIDEQTKIKLFQSFSQGDESTTRRFGGTGLGLAITKELVEMMGGVIGVESVPGEGSRFFFDLKLKTAKYQESTKVEEARESLEACDGYVLVAEDNLTNQRVAAAMLKSIGCRFKLVANGIEAIAALTNEEFDLVLMDGQMPELDGYETTRHIRGGAALERNRQIPIVAVTANAIKGDLERCLEAGMNDYISKPISQHDLRIKVRKWLKSGANVIDVAAITKLRQLDSDGSQELLGQIVEIFNKTTPQVVAEMRKALEARNFLELNQQAHSFKSSCANVGASRMRELASRIEKSDAGSDYATIDNLINALERDFATVSEELKKHVAA